MPSNGEHLAATVQALDGLRSAVDALTDELTAVRQELETLNGKTPTLVNGKVPALVTANGNMPVAVNGTVQVSSTQLPTQLQGGKVKVTGLL